MIIFIMNLINYYLTMRIKFLKKLIKIVRFLYFVEEGINQFQQQINLENQDIKHIM